MAETREESIVEEREELMVSLSGGSPTLRIAHFLNPPAKSSIDVLKSPLSFHFTPNPKKLSFKVAFPGWRSPQQKWESWKDRMRVLHQSLWKKTRIYDAIMSCGCETRRCNDLIFELAKRWRSETNTFIFPWGEATVTLEDMMALGGYSVLGDPVWKSPHKELKMVEEKLEEARLQFVRTTAHKAQHCTWINYFTENQSEVEHEAFLSLWLSRFVFPGTQSAVILRFVFPIAILLARGTLLALAPAVLATIYRDLSLLNHNLSIGGNGHVLALTSPLQLVQIWALHRFPSLRADPRCYQWHNSKAMKVNEMSSALDSAMDSFQWRPYVVQPIYNFLSSKFYRDREKWVSVNDLDDDLQSLARCLRVSELVGMDCIEQYLPIRVAMQFGIDQNIPVRVERFNRTKELGWKNYSRPIGGTRLYIPSWLFESGVTTRYLKWWNQNSSTGKRDENHSSDLSRISVARNDICCPVVLESDDESDEDEIRISQLLMSPRKKHNKRENGVTSSYDEAGRNLSEDIQSPVTGCRPINLESDDEFVDEDVISTSQPWVSRKKHKITESRMTRSRERTHKITKRERDLSEGIPSPAMIRCPINLESGDESVDEDVNSISQLSMSPKKRHKRRENRTASSCEETPKTMKREMIFAEAIQSPITRSKSCSNQNKCPRREAENLHSDDGSKESNTKLENFENGDEQKSATAMEEGRDCGFIYQKLEEIERSNNDGSNYGETEAATGEYQGGLGHDDWFEGENISFLKVEELALKLDARVKILEGVIDDLKLKYHKRS